MREYDQIADWYSAARNPEVGASDVADFARTLPPGAQVLDLGCGTGIPVSQRLRRDGFEVVGLDSSPAMIERYRANVPGAPARCERVQEARFPAESFEGVVAWGVLFHLSEADQESTVFQVSEWLTPGGRFLFTSAEAGGQTESQMDGVTFRYLSLGASRYRSLAERAGMRLDRRYRDAWDNYVYIAVKAD